MKRATSPTTFHQKSSRKTISVFGVYHACSLCRYYGLLGIIFFIVFSMGCSAPTVGGSCYGRLCL